MEHPRHARGRSDDGQAHFDALHRGAKVDVHHIAQHPRHEFPLGEGIAIPTQGKLLLGSAPEEIKHHRRQFLLRKGAEVGYGETLGELGHGKDGFGGES